MDSSDISLDESPVKPPDPPQQIGSEGEHNSPPFENSIPSKESTDYLSMDLTEKKRKNDPMQNLVTKLNYRTEGVHQKAPPSLGVALNVLADSRSEGDSTQRKFSGVSSTGTSTSTSSKNVIDRMSPPESPWSNTSPSDGETEVVIEGIASEDEISSQSDGEYVEETRKSFSNASSNNLNSTYTSSMITDEDIAAVTKHYDSQKLKDFDSTTENGASSSSHKMDDSHDSVVNAKKTPNLSIAQKNSPVKSNLRKIHHWGDASDNSGIKKKKKSVSFGSEESRRYAVDSSLKNVNDSEEEGEVENNEEQTQKRGLALPFQPSSRLSKAANAIKHGLSSPTRVMANKISGFRKKVAVNPLSPDASKPFKVPLSSDGVSATAEAEAPVVEPVADDLDSHKTTEKTVTTDSESDKQLLTTTHEEKNETVSLTAPAPSTSSTTIFMEGSHEKAYTKPSDVRTRNRLDLVEEFAQPRQLFPESPSRASPRRNVLSASDSPSDGEITPPGRISKSSSESLTDLCESLSSLNASILRKTGENENAVAKSKNVALIKVANGDGNLNRKNGSSKGGIAAQKKKKSRKDFMAQLKKTMIQRGDYIESTDAYEAI